jgi:hypothetical protein
MGDYIELRDAPDSLRKRRFDAFLLGAQEGLDMAHMFMRSILDRNQQYSIDNALSPDPDLDYDHLTWFCANNNELSTQTYYGNTKKKLFTRILDKMYAIKPTFYHEEGKEIPMLSVIAYELQEQFKCDNDLSYAAVPDIKNALGKQYQLKLSDQK